MLKLRFAFIDWKMLTINRFIRREQMLQTASAKTDFKGTSLRRFETNLEFMPPGTPECASRLVRYPRSESTTSPVLAGRVNPSNPNRVPGLIPMA
jgi:hypothetical protein